MVLPSTSGKNSHRFGKNLFRRNGPNRWRRYLFIAGLLATLTFCFLNLYGAGVGLTPVTFGNIFTIENDGDPTSVFRKVNENVLYFDEFAYKNVKATMQSAYSFVEWHSFSFGYVRKKDNLAQFQTAPLLATVDRRPLIAKRQMVLDKEGLHNNGKVLGCAMTGTTFVSNLGYIYRKFEKLPVRCDLCIQFASRVDAKNFLDGIGYETLEDDQTSTATKCFNGSAQLHARFPEWQKTDERFKGYGYPWTVNCALPNGIKELTCEGISKLQDYSFSKDGIHKIYFETNFALDGYFSTPEPKTFNVVTRWPWDALRSHNDDRSIFASKLPEAWNDQSSMFVPSSAKELKLAHAEGPGYSKTMLQDDLALESMSRNPNSYGGVHKRFVTNLLHIIRNAPNSTHIMAVVDGQVHASYERVVTLLNTRITDLYPNNCNAIFAHYNKLVDKQYIPLNMFDRSPAKPNRLYDDVTLKDVLLLRGIKLHMVPLSTPSIAFEKNVCGVQYAFTSYLAARFAADYHVMMYIDGDTAMLENSEMMQEIYYNRFFSKKSTKCVGHRFRLIEQFVSKENIDNTDRALQCVHELANDSKRWKYMAKNCQLKEGHIVARTDSIFEFSVHHPDTIKEYVPTGIKDCITKGNKENDEYFLKEKEIVQIHLRDRIRKPECSCFVKIPT